MCMIVIKTPDHEVPEIYLYCQLQWNYTPRDSPFIIAYALLYPAFARYIFPTRLPSDSVDKSIVSFITFLSIFYLLACFLPHYISPN